MDELSVMLGECSDCLDDYLGDDVAPAQIEADAQNRAVLRKRRRAAMEQKLRTKPKKLQRVLDEKAKRIEKLLIRKPQLAQELSDELGKFTIGGAFKSIGKGLTAPLRVVGKVATGDFKGALKAAADPMGLSTALRKGKHTVQDVKRVIGAPQKALASAGANLAAHAGFGVPSLPAALQMKCTPCDSGVSEAVVKRVVPEMQRVQKLLDKMELSRKATSEHKRKRQQEKWRKEVLRLLHRIQEKRCA